MSINIRYSVLNGKKKNYKYPSVVLENKMRKMEKSFKILKD